MIVWKSATVSPRRASFRYRVALPAIYLERRGFRLRIGWHPRWVPLFRSDVLVLSKTFYTGDLALARRAHERRIPIVYDLCDNIFVESYPVRARAVFDQIALLASLIVTPTEALAEQARRHVRTEVPVVVIPDSVERPADTAAIIKRFTLTARLEAAYLMLIGFVYRAAMIKKLIPVYLARRKGPVDAVIYGVRKASILAWGAVRERLSGRSSAARNTGIPAPAASSEALERGSDSSAVLRPKLITWFGNHGGEHADFGMLDLQMAAPALESISRRLPIKLRVISNNATKYRKCIATLPVPSEYIEWSPDMAPRKLAESDVVIIPSTQNDFTRCKSANRLILALDTGIPVVATRTLATSEFEGAVIFDEWERGIESYLTDPALRASHLAKAREIIHERFSPEAIADKWRSVLTEVKNRSAQPSPTSRSGPVLVLLVNLVQDLELILPIYRKARQRSYWDVEVWVTTHDLLKRSEMYNRLAAAGVSYQLAEPYYAPNGGFPSWRGVSALLSASESTADPHLEAHKTVKVARKHGVRTYTMQHGFQNVGLTYGDERFPVNQVRFESDLVFLWGTLESLHPDVPNETRGKCVSVGCPKPIDASQRSLPRRFTEPLVAVFENLHSARYEDAYRERFLEHLLAVMRIRPDVRFLIKPHPAGQYLTARHKQALRLPDNATLADPRATEWVNVSAADILSHATAVITSVTTVAFDAALAGKAVAIAGAHYVRDLSTFRPLTILQTADDWSTFVSRTVDKADPALTELSRKFAEKAAMPGDAGERMLDAIAADLRARGRLAA